jgi:IS30 family transposase
MGHRHGRRKLLSEAQVQQAREWRAQGWTARRIGAELSCSTGTVFNTVGPRQAVVPGREAWQPAEGRLSLAEREEISLGLGRGEAFSCIASRLGRAASTVSREVKGNGGRRAYRAWRAHARAFGQSRRPKLAKLACPRLAAQVDQWLRLWWSPEEIARRLRIDFPCDPMMWVSHETIYQSLFVQGRGELRRELTACLRSGRAQRRPQGSGKNGGRIPGMVMIADRPPEAEDRAVPGHWEGDLIIGKNGKSAVGTLVERSTRYVLLLHLPDGRDAYSVDTAMRRAIAKLPGELFRTITWDQGKEMARHAAFSIDTGIPVYFCDPHSPWQRGTNENTNGLLRQYMPKGTDLSQHDAQDLDRIARSLNGRPRKTLGFMKPLERLSEFLAQTG